MNKKLLRVLIAGMLLAAVAIGISCAGKSFGFGKKDEAVFSGTIETREIRVGSKVGGRIEAVLVEEGQEVTAGQPLVRFDIAELQTQKAQAEARIEQQQARLERLMHGARPEEKAQAGAATATAQATLESVKTWPRPEEVEQARAAVAAAEADLG
ncbi:MAG: HlyD family secretion protein, partial [Blastocatellia bacterium]